MSLRAALARGVVLGARRRMRRPPLRRQIRIQRCTAVRRADGRVVRRLIRVARAHGLKRRNRFTAVAGARWVRLFQIIRCTRRTPGREGITHQLHE